MKRIGTATITEGHGVKLPAGTKPKKPAKYRNQPVVVDSIRFDSKREAARYRELVLLESVGRISDLHIHPRFRLEVNGSLICYYVADFQYRDDSGHVVIEDVKGVRTPAYRLKRALMLAVLRIAIREV